jgi:hypothetical protein
MRLFLKQRRDRVQQLQLNLASEENIVLEPIVERPLVELMAKVMLAVVRGKETGNDHPSS